MQLPPIIYGTAWKKEATKELVIQAVRAGFRAIDTACQKRHYNEAGVGEALHALAKEGIQRDQLFIQTKFTPIAGQDLDSAPYDPNAALSTQVAQSFEVSLKNLQTDYVNSLVLHSPIFPYKDLLEVWSAMEQIYENAQTHALGISNIYDLPTLKRFYDDASIKPSYVQNRFYAESDYDVELRKWCLQHGIVYQSFWTLTANPHILQDETLFQLSRTHKKNVVQILFSYLHQTGVTPLTGTTDPEHMRDDLQSFDITLSDEEIRSMDRLFI